MKVKELKDILNRLDDNVDVNCVVNIDDPEDDHYDQFCEFEIHGLDGVYDTNYIELFCYKNINKD